MKLWRITINAVHPDGSLSRRDGLIFVSNTFQVGRALDQFREALSWPRNPGDEVWITLSEVRDQ